MVHRRRLRNELRRERESAGLTQKDVADAMDWSLSKLIRIEAGAVSVTTNDLRVLLGHYGINDSSRVDAMIGMARLARSRSPWQEYRDYVPPELLTFLAYESASSVIRNFEPLFMPGLLQTEDYARAALTAAFDVEKSASETEKLIELRMERQDIMNRPGVRLHFVLDEAVIRRVAGGAEVMRRQLRHLLDICTKPNVGIRIVPYTHGLYPRFQTPHVLFEFSDPEDEDILYIENPRGDLLVREGVSGEVDSSTPANYLASFLQLQETLGAEHSVALIESAIGALG